MNIPTAPRASEPRLRILLLILLAIFIAAPAHAQSDRYPDGVWFFDLAAMRQAAEWLNALALALAIAPSGEREVLARITESLADFGKPRSLPAPAGSAIFMHCITPHASLPNRSNRARRTLIYEYRANDAFPIYYGEMTNLAEAKFRIIRGRPARFARFGGPRPMIPNVGKYTSLYELQSQAKARMK